MRGQQVQCKKLWGSNKKHEQTSYKRDLLHLSIVERLHAAQVDQYEWRGRPVLLGHWPRPRNCWNACVQILARRSGQCQKRTTLANGANTVDASGVRVLVWCVLKQTCDGVKQLT